jgi:penicillin amidase
VSTLRSLLRYSLGARLPEVTGLHALRGLRHEATIRRDAYGVPYIDAACEHDGWFALGYCHAQDRAAQLELVVRAVRGTLAALIEKDGLSIDRLSRRIGFRRAGEAQLAAAEPAVRDQLTAYALGINAGLARDGRRAHEHVLLRSRPTMWEPADVQGYAALLCFALASNWDVELLRLKILAEDGPRALALLDAPYPADLPLCVPPGACASAAVDRLAEDIERFGSMFGRSGGSNAWAVGPERTATGRPILANDPHLPAAVPTTVYLACIHTPAMSIAGASWVGLPCFGPGHNGYCAWGLTAAHVDNTDLFLEEVSRDGTSVRRGDGWQRCTVREERIEVRGEKPEIERVLVTPHGPVITFEDAPCMDGMNAISLAATWLAPRPYTGMFRAHTARSFEAFRQLFARGSTSTVSAVYADTDGHIGWHVAVEVPKRKSGHGLLPLPAWQHGVGWHEEPHACTELPFVHDPVEGFVCTANNRPAADDGEPYLGVDFLDGYRQAAISQALGTRRDWDIDATCTLQRNTASLPWQALRDTVLEAARDAREANGQGEALGLARALLADWDGRVAADSIGASVFELFFAELCCVVVRAIAPRAADWALGKSFTQLIPHATIATRRTAHLVRMVLEQQGGVVPSWPQAIRASLVASVTTLRRLHGADPQAWHWGKVRSLTLIHAFAQKKPFDQIFNVGPMPGEGDPSTIAQGGVDFANPTTAQLWLPVLRAVLDVGDWDRCRFSIAGGQSGNPLSPHYADQLDSWRTGWGVPLSWTEARIRARTRHTLRLTPRALEATPTRVVREAPGRG